MCLLQGLARAVQLASTVLPVAKPSFVRSHSLHKLQARWVCSPVAFVVTVSESMLSLCLSNILEDVQGHRWTASRLLIGCLIVYLTSCLHRLISFHSTEPHVDDTRCCQPGQSASVQIPSEF